MKKVDTISEINIKKYAYPPSWDVIYDFMQELGMSNHRFEKFFGIPFNIISQIKLGTKRLPPYAWHYVYEKIVPKIGPGYTKVYGKKPIPNNIPKTITQTITFSNTLNSIVHETVDVAYQPDNPTSVANEHDKLQGEHDRTGTLQ